MKHSKAIIVLLLLGLYLQGWSAPGCEPRAQRFIGDLEIEHPVPIIWSELEPGLFYTSLIFNRRDTNQKIMLAALAVDPRKFRLSLLETSETGRTSPGWVHAMGDKAGAIAAVNGSFYLSETYEPIGLLVSRGKVRHQYRSAAGSGVFRNSQGLAHIDWAKDYSPAWDRDDLALQAGPLLIEPGRKPGIFQNARKYRSRTAVGIDGRGRAVLVCTFRESGVEEDFSGLDLFELMEILLLAEERGGLGLKAALNLDGGTSSAMYINHPRLQLDIRSTHPVSNAIAVFQK